jgi:hypothetical protein
MELALLTVPARSWDTLRQFGLGPGRRGAHRAVMCCFPRSSAEFHLPESGADWARWD